MRKLSLFLAAFIFAATAWSQNGGELITNAEMMFRRYYFDYMYGEDTTSLVIKEASIIENLNGHLEIVRYDKNLNEVTRSSMDIPVNCKYITGFNNKEGIDILLSEKNEEGTKLDVYHEHLSPTTFEPVGELINLGTLTGEKTDNLGFICRQSPDKMLTAGIFVTQREGQSAEARVTLYDRNLEEYWSMTTRLRVMDFASVNDSGVVVIGGYRPQAIPDRNDFEIIVLDGEKNHTYNFTLDAGEISKVDFASWRDSKLYLLAIGRKKKKKSDDRDNADRLISICFNTVNDKVTSDSYIFSEEEINCMNNSNSHKKIHFLGIEHSVEAPDGHYDVLLTRTWLFSGSNGSCIFTSGIMIATINPDGSIKRVYTHPHYAGNSPHGRLADYHLIRTNGGSLFIYSDSKKNKDRKRTKKFKTYRAISDKAELIVLFIPDDGEIVEKHFPTERFSLINSPIPIEKNKYMLFMEDHKSLRFSTLDLQ